MILEFDDDTLLLIAAYAETFGVESDVFVKALVSVSVADGGLNADAIEKLLRALVQPDG